MCECGGGVCVVPSCHSVRSLSKSRIFEWNGTLHNTVKKWNKCWAYTCHSFISHCEIMSCPGTCLMVLISIYRTEEKYQDKYVYNTRYLSVKEDSRLKLTDIHRYPRQIWGDGHLSIKWHLSCKRKYICKKTTSLYLSLIHVALYKRIDSWPSESSFIWGLSEVSV